MEVEFYRRWVEMQGDWIRESECVYGTSQTQSFPVYRIYPRRICLFTSYHSADVSRFPASKALPPSVSSLEMREKGTNNATTVVPSTQVIGVG